MEGKGWKSNDDFFAKCLKRKYFHLLKKEEEKCDRKRREKKKEKNLSRKSQVMDMRSAGYQNFSREWRERNTMAKVNGYCYCRGKITGLIGNMRWKHLELDANRRMRSECENLDECMSRRVKEENYSIFSVFFTDPLYSSSQCIHEMFANIHPQFVFEKSHHCMCANKLSKHWPNFDTTLSPLKFTFHFHHSHFFIAPSVTDLPSSHPTHFHSSNWMNVSKETVKGSNWKTVTFLHPTIMDDETVNSQVKVCLMYQWNHSHHITHSLFINTHN